jgi:heme A synthase
MILLKLSFATLCVLFTLIFVGGYVGASGAGLSCPKWPLCPTGLVPSSEFIIEYFHRSLAATTSILVIATMVFTLKSKIAPKQMKLASVIASGAAIGQITLGAIVILQQLHALLVTIHLGLGLVLFATTLLTVIYAYRLSSSSLLLSQGDDRKKATIKTNSTNNKRSETKTTTKMQDSNQD